MKEKEYTEISLCWSFYRFMVDNLLHEIDSFIIAFSLDSEKALYVAKKEGIDIEEEHKYLFGENGGKE